jgi:hypothetical protein
MDLKSISACLVTRDSAICPEIMDSLSGFGEIIVTTDSRSVYGRFDAVSFAKYPLVYTQDDDFLVTDFSKLIRCWDGRFVTHHNCRWNLLYRAPFTTIGYGAIFQRDLAMEALDIYEYEHGRDDYFYRECDMIVTGLCNPKRANFLGAPRAMRYEPTSIGRNLANSDAPACLHNQPEQKRFWHGREKVRELVKKYSISWHGNSDLQESASNSCNAGHSALSRDEAPLHSQGSSLA